MLWCRVGQEADFGFASEFKPLPTMKITISRHAIIFFQAAAVLFSGFAVRGVLTADQGVDSAREQQRAATASGALQEHDAVQFQPPVIIDKPDPIYPFSLSSQAIYSGTLTALVEIDMQGRISDWLPVRATHDDFIRQVGSVFPRWRFQPAMENGEPVPSAMEIRFEFSYNNVLLNMNSFESTSAFLNRMRIEPGAREYFANFADLDRLPEPREIVKPIVYSDIPEDERKGEVVLSFFIDQEGRVRMPALTQLDGNMELALSAEQAVRQWRFDPPTVNGRRVIVKAAQRFIFVDDEGSN